MVGHEWRAGRNAIRRECYILPLTMRPTLYAPGSWRGERLLHLCIGASIVVHALAMFYAPKSAPPLPPIKIKATLRAEPVAPSVPAPAAPEPEVAPPPPLAAAQPLPMLPAKSVAEKAPAHSAAPPLAEAAPVAPPPVPAPATTPSQTRSAVPASDVKDATKAPAAAPPAHGDLSDAQIIDAYASQVVGIIETKKLARMPREAVDNGWQGNTIVLIRIGADGNIAEVSIAKSSGYEVLDSTARIGASRAKQFVPVPAALRGKAFEIRGDITFKIVEK